MSWTSSVAHVNGIRMHYVREGSGPPVVLLHGWPQTWYEWRKLIPALAERHTVIAPDLRGYGLSDKPTTGYDKRTMAADVQALIAHLGYAAVILVGHDRGARVAHRLALDAPQFVEKAVFLDIVPTRAVLRMMDAGLARGFWHWFFHLQPDLPEALIGPRIDVYLRYFFERWAHNRAGLEPDAIDAYIRAYAAPGALRAGFDDYRATLLDVEHDDLSAVSGRRLTMPVLLLWGKAGLLHRLPSVLDIWREYAADVHGEAIDECGHFLPEEQPRAVLERLLEFFRAPGQGGAGAA